MIKHYIKTLKLDVNECYIEKIQKQKIDVKQEQQNYLFKKRYKKAPSICA